MFCWKFFLLKLPSSPWQNNFILEVSVLAGREKLFMKRANKTPKPGSVSILSMTSPKSQKCYLLETLESLQFDLILKAQLSPAVDNVSHDFVQLFCQPPSIEALQIFWVAYTSDDLCSWRSFPDIQSKSPQPQLDDHLPIFFLITCRSKSSLKSDQWVVSMHSCEKDE